MLDFYLCLLSRKDIILKKKTGRNKCELSVIALLVCTCMYDSILKIESGKLSIGHCANVLYSALYSRALLPEIHFS